MRLVLNEVREPDRQQQLRRGGLKQINRNAELKRAYDLLVKGLPEEQRQSAVAQIARQAKRAVPRTLCERLHSAGEAGTWKDSAALAY